MFSFRRVRNNGEVECSVMHWDFIPQQRNAKGCFQRPFDTEKFSECLNNGNQNLNQIKQDCKQQTSHQK